MTTPEKSSLQPKLWLVGTALLVGFGIGLLVVSDPSENPLRPQPSPVFFGLTGVIQGLVGWFALRGGENPKDSMMARFLESQWRLSGLEIPPKPLLWMTAFVLFVLASASLTMASASLTIDVGEMI